MNQHKQKKEDFIKNYNPLIILNLLPNKYSKNKLNKQQNLLDQK